MNDITVIPLRREHWSEIASWENLGIERDSDGWVAVLDGEILGVGVITSTPEHVAYLDFEVKRSARRQGVGAQLVEGILSSPYVKTLTHLKARVTPDNTAAQKILTRRGFSRVGTSPEGQLEFERH